MHFWNVTVYRFFEYAVSFKLALSCGLRHILTATLATWQNVSGASDYPLQSNPEQISLQDKHLTLEQALTRVMLQLSSLQFKQK